MSILKNRHEFMFYLSCTDANPNGDPDMGNLPRVDMDTMSGYITDAAIKRRVRDYIEMAHGQEEGMGIFVQQGVNLNRKIAEAKHAAGAEKDKTPSGVEKSRAAACSMYWDVRTFGAVMSTGPNAGQVRGPVQVSFGRSLDPVRPVDISITRVASADVVKDGVLKDYQELEAASDESRLRTIGRKQFIPYGLYEIHGFVSANFATQTGFSEHDLMYFFEALANMYDHCRSSSKGTMSVVSPVIVFRHVGDPSGPENQGLLGCAPAHKLFELVQVTKRDGVLVPTSYQDYECKIRLSDCPPGVCMGFVHPYTEGIEWGGCKKNDWVSLV